MRPTALGDKATQLPWLSPCAASLQAWARCTPQDAWSRIRVDPGAVLTVLRLAGKRLVCPGVSFFPALLRDPSVLGGVIPHLDRECLVDWGREQVRSIYEAALAYATMAERLADLSQSSDANNAWVAGLLAPLGWLAVATVDPAGAAACTTRDGQSTIDDLQRKHWGIDHSAIARRLALKWSLPRWLAVISGNLSLPADTAELMGADPALFRLVQAAVALVQRHGAGLGLVVGTPLSENLAFLRVSEEEIGSVNRNGQQESPSRPAAQSWQAASSVPLLRDLLDVAVDRLRLLDAPSLEQIQADFDALHSALRQLRCSDALRMQDLKLRALAEFAAGAAHEINNPLAVISGQAQYLLGRTEDATGVRALQTIIAQAQRVHQVLLDLMHFARPRRPQVHATDLRALIRETSLSLSDFARQQQIDLVCPEPSQPIVLMVDGKQIAAALESLLRNAIEAAPPQGWVRLVVDASAPDKVDVLVEDSGAGPLPSQREHLFDPFYSGRESGRGRGLGLSTAWRFADQNGGGLRLDETSPGLTRFVLTLPRVAEPPDSRANGHTSGNGSNGCGAVAGSLHV